MQTIAILSPGDMGHAVGRWLCSQGHRVVTSLANRSKATRARAQRAGFEDVGDLAGVVTESEIVLSILPPAEAERLADEVASVMQREARTPLYADCNAVSPATVRRIADRIGRAGAPFVDAGIVGGPPKDPRSPTRFYVSGNEASRLACLGAGDAPQIEVRRVGDQVGQASALKMMYAGLTKGTMTLHAAMLIAAERLGLFDVLARELEESQPQAWARMGVLPFLPADAGRWIGEMQQIAETLRSVDVDDGFHRAAEAIFRIMDATPFAAETRETLDRSRSLAEAVRVFAATKVEDKDDR